MVEKEAVFAKKFEILKALIKNSRSTVVLTGAGISTLSGIPDFRSSSGVYANTWKSYQVEEILSISFFKHNPEIFYEWAKEFWYKLDLYQPNAVHTALALLEQKGYLEGLFTQNIDMLHKKAGSKKCYEVHGSAEHHHCTNCNAYYSYQHVAPLVLAGQVPLCKDCGGVIKPDIVFYGENLDSFILSRAYEMFNHAQLCIVLGSSLVVQPAASFPAYTVHRGAPLVIVNAQKTSFDGSATIKFNDLQQWGQALLPWIETLKPR
ncbi:NAD-dependent protein deacylase [Sphaerochaeta globosa]|uniref:protein acetyllysine N-acetyltransferase n=1 Tax=Sphaerochaeta globosa (strain ATCC BAA-1886 / DSM 22777 / Buddy) TaxID=158189 RepID=F0RZ34_SPHGB|nr:NAD-dependent protein deacylase [Sphaerochaeta globosa]ADY13241.1 NAD-dependent deacetylase [Sphaerochaeta globosa str. Buddy]